MTTRLYRAALALAAVCASVSLAYAANPTFWQVSNEAEFAKGDVENLSIDGYGRLTLGPLWRGHGDPTMRMTPDGVWRATRTPEGPATIRFAVGPDRLDVAAWGPGADWAIETGGQVAAQHHQFTFQSWVGAGYFRHYIIRVNVIVKKFILYVQLQLHRNV